MFLMSSLNCYTSVVQSLSICLHYFYIYTHSSAKRALNNTFFMLQVKILQCHLCSLRPLVLALVSHVCFLVLHFTLVLFIVDLLSCTETEPKNRLCGRNTLELGEKAMPLVFDRSFKCEMVNHNQVFSGFI